VLPAFGFRSLAWSSLRLRTKGLIVVGIAGLPLIAFWVLVALTILRGREPSNNQTRSLTVQAALARVQADLLEADAGVRDFILTDNPRARMRYLDAIGRLGADLAVLDNAVIDLDIRDQLRILQDVTTDELCVLAKLTGTPLPPNAPPIPRLGERASLNRSEENLDRVRSLASSMEKRQRDLAAKRSEQNLKAQTMFFLAFLVGSVVCIGAGAVAASILTKGISRRAAALARNADRLALGLPLEAMTSDQDEIGRVDARLRETAKLLLRREQDLRERSHQLEAANHELEAFSYSVSHDLRAPLRAIDGFSTVIEQDQAIQLGDQSSDALRRVRAAAKRMGVLIDELLNLSRLTRSEVRRERVDIAAAATAILTDLARHGPDRKVEVRIDPNLRVNADPELAHIALQNLLDNAWKYTRKTPSARIEVGATPNGVANVFHIRDNGAGFDMAHAGRLFGAFQRLHHDRDFDGTGIGLAIVQRIVNRHGGRIWAEAAVNAGATFYFTLEPETQAH
jgi:signal transduction histidine kinase